MGIGGPPACEPLDLIESSIIEEPHGYAQRFKNRVFKHFNKHRDALGYPKGTKEYPYFVCSNDLCTIASEFMDLVIKNKDKPCALEILHDLPNVLQLLIKSYDEKCDDGCCGPWHSMEKEKFVELRKMMKVDQY